MDPSVGRKLQDNLGHSGGSVQRGEGEDIPRVRRWGLIPGKYSEKFVPSVAKVANAPLGNRSVGSMLLYNRFTLTSR